LNLPERCDCCPREIANLRYFLWQLALQVCIWLSQLLKQGTLKVTGQARLHEALSLAQLEKQASVAPSANRNLFRIPLSAAWVVPHATIKKVATSTDFMVALRHRAKGW